MLSASGVPKRTRARPLLSDQFLSLQPAYELCGKVMFSQVSVCSQGSLRSGENLAFSIGVRLLRGVCFLGRGICTLRGSAFGWVST